MDLTPALAQTDTPAPRPAHPRSMVAHRLIRTLPTDSFLRTFDLDLATELVGSALVRSFGRGEVIARQGGPRRGPVHLVLGGWILESQTHQGGCQNLSLRGPGEVLGDTAVFGSPVPSSSTCEGPVLTAALSAVRLERFLNANPAALAGFTQVMTRRLQWAQYQYAGVARPSEERIAAFIHDLAVRWGEPTPEGHRVIKGISQSHIAGTLVMSRASVENTLRWLRELRIVRTGYRSILVLDLPYLRKFALSYDIALDPATAVARPRAAGEADSATP